jgi:hypothetical protein
MLLEETSYALALNNYIPSPISPGINQLIHTQSQKMISFGSTRASNYRDEELGKIVSNSGIIFQTDSRRIGPI